MVATAAFISKPDVTLNLLARGGETGVEEHRILLVGQLLTGSVGWVRDVPRNDADINARFGARSHLAMMARAVRKVNKYTEMDAIALADASGGTAGTAKCVFAGTATEAKEVFFDVVSAADHSYEVSVEIGDTPQLVTAKLKARIDADATAPFTAAVSQGTADGDTITFTAANEGTLSNNWGIALRGGPVAGLTTTIAGWSGGASDPTLMDIFDPVEAVRYQTVIWPEAYTITEMAAWIDGRKNVNNDVKDGVAFLYSNTSFANVKAAALARNSSEIVILHNEARNESHWKGPHILEAPDAIAAAVGAVRALRFEDDVTITPHITSIEPFDQFGGIHTSTLPYFNTVLRGLSQPERGTGLTQAEQAELRGAGVAVLGANEFNNALILGTIVTTYQNDPAGNPDDSWQFLNWRDTHSVVREFFHNNFKRRFAQYRMSTGEAVPGYAIATEGLLRAYAMELYDSLSEIAVTVQSRDAQRHMRDNMIVNAVPGQRKFDVYFDVPILSQTERILGSVRFNFAVDA